MPLVPAALLAFLAALGLAGDKPAIHVPTSNPYQPYARVGECPPGSVPVVIDWPKKGDMNCRKPDGTPAVLPP